jgi:undecaprenyl-diphosphatase
MRLAAVICLALFAVVSLLVSTGTTQHADVAVLQWVGRWRTPWLTSAEQTLSRFGNWQWEVPFALSVSLLLWWRGRRTSAWRFFALGVFGEALYAIAKLLFHRPRPTVLSHLGQAGWYSYPSGHAMLAVIIWGTGLVLLAQLVGSRAIRRSFVVLAVLLPIAIAKARVYLGVHYLTDVTGGVLLGLVWVLFWWDAVCDVTPTTEPPATQ